MSDLRVVETLVPTLATWRMVSLVDMTAYASEDAAAEALAPYLTTLAKYRHVRVSCAHTGTVTLIVPARSGVSLRKGE